jgi:RelE toxin of RelE / RelB toxin-antitoxin system
VSSGAEHRLHARFGIFPRESRKLFAPHHRYGIVGLVVGSVCGGFRTLISYRRSERAVFLFGFAKNERANIDDDELDEWQHVGRLYLALDERKVERR